MNPTNDVYVISLDAVDLNLLPISQKHRDGGAVPLWSTSNYDSRRKKFYEFVIKTDDTKEDQNETIIENVICHICDINVPKGYFNEHKNGFLHKFNRKVADTALKRLQLYVTKEDVNEYNEKFPSKHFCTECSIVIDSEDETSHKQTTGHRNSLFLERFLNDFLNFYTNDDKEIDDIRKYIKTKIMKESTNFEQDFVSDGTDITKTVIANIKKESIKIEDVIETKGAENYKKILNSDELNNNLRPSSDLQDEVAFLEVFDGSNINKFKVTEMCYDAIVATGVTSEYCMICNQMFVRENRFLHVDSELHDQNLRQKSLDKDCVRKVNISHHHCVLCNDYFTEYDLHVNSEEHLTNFRNKIIYKCKKTVQDNGNCGKDKKFDNSRKYSDVLKSDEIKSSTSTHMNTAPVNKETKNSLVPSTSSIVAKTKTVENSDKTVKLDPKSYFCKVCQVQVPNNLFNIAEHNGGRSHMLKDNKPIEERAVNPADEVREIDETAENWDKTVKIDPNSTFRNVSQVEVPNTLNNIAENNGGRSHMLKDNKPIEERAANPADEVVREIDETAENWDKTVKIDPNSYLCNVSQVEVPNTPNNIAEHNGGWSHMLKDIKPIKERAANPADEVREIDETAENWYKTVKIDPNSYLCNVSQVEVPNTPNNIAEHNGGRSHMLKDIKPIEERAVNAADEVREIDETAENCGKTVKLVPNSSFLNVSQVEVPNTLNNIAENNGGWSHLLKENELIEAREAADKVREIDENKKTSNRLVSRINSSINIGSKQFCDTCNKWISIKRFQRHTNRNSHLLNAISDYRYLLTFLDKENSFCVICQETVLKDLKDITNHFTSSDHIIKYNKLLKAQSIIKIDNDKYYCILCEVNILHKNELLHIDSKVHTDKVSFSEIGEIDEQNDDVTESVDGDATEATALVDSNTVGGGSDSATDNVQVNTNNDTALENFNHFDSNSINSNSVNTLSEKLESIFLKYLSKIEPSNDGEIDSDDNDSEINETPKKKAKRDLKSHFCNTSEVLVANNPNSITDHNKSAKHMRKLKMYHVVNGTLVKKITNLHYQMVKTAILNVVKCIVCHIDLTYSDRNILTHIEGESHKSNYKEFCAKNLLVLHFCILFCNACGVKAGPGDEFKHCNGEKHKKNLKLVALNGHQ